MTAAIAPINPVLTATGYQNTSRDSLRFSAGFGYQLAYFGVDFLKFGGVHIWHCTALSLLCCGVHWVLS